MKKEALYLVKWDDHFSSAGWVSKGPYQRKTYRVKTVGYFIDEDDKHIHLAMSNTNNLYGDVMSILKNCIVSKKEIK